MSLVALLRALRDSYVFLRPEMAHRYETAIDRAVELEARLNELHDAIERSIELLNSESKYGRDGNDMESALAELNKVL
jgi:hypothetical protein